MNPNAIKLVAVAAAALASQAALAQDKTDGLWRGTGGAALSVTSGNTSSSSLVLNADAVKVTTADKLVLGAAINYAKNKTGGVNQTTANKWGGFGQYNYNLAAPLFVFGRASLEGDELIDLSLRAALAGGLGYKLIDTKTDSFELTAGAGYTTDSYDVAQTIGGKTAKRHSRASLYFGESSSHQITPTVAFKQRLDVYPGVTGDKAVIAKFSAGLSVALSSTMNLTVGVTDAYNSKPPSGTKSNDLGVFTGVNLKFGAP